MSRPRLHKDSREKVKAFRANPDTRRFDVTVSAQTGATLDKLAAQFDVPRNVVIARLINFALLNREWSRLGGF